MKTILIVGSLLAALSGSAYAAAPEPDELINKIATDLMSSPKEPKTKQEIYALADKTLSPVLNIGKLPVQLLGMYAKELTAEQKKGFSEAVKLMLIKGYAGQLAGSEKSKLSLEKPKIEGDRARVKGLFTKDKQALPVIFELELVEDQWKLEDVKIEGVSFISAFKAAFISIYKNEGFDGLMTTIREKTKL